MGLRIWEQLWRRRTLRRTWRGQVLYNRPCETNVLACLKIGIGKTFHWVLSVSYLCFVFLNKTAPFMGVAIPKKGPTHTHTPLNQFSPGGSGGACKRVAKDTGLGWMGSYFGVKRETNQQDTLPILLLILVGGGGGLPILTLPGPFCYLFFVWGGGGFRSPYFDTARMGLDKRNTVVENCFRIWISLDFHSMQSVPAP